MFLSCTFLFLLLLLLGILTKEWICAAVASGFLFLLLIHFIRSYIIARNIRRMSCHEKEQTLQELIQPFGYHYESCQDIFSTILHPWQRKFGYGTIYDTMAPHFQMIFDALPIYFDYDGRTWLIEIWKGQYGINTGAEIGIYHADRILPPTQYSRHIFEAASDDELLCIALELKKKGRTIACLKRLHWWLTCFCMGIFSNPADLSVHASITFPNMEMLHAFALSLSSDQWTKDLIYISGHTITFTFSNCPSCHSPLPHRLYLHFTQWKNRLFCTLFLNATYPFVTSIDRLLFLYFYAPFAFRKIFSMHFKKQVKKKEPFLS